MARKFITTDIVDPVKAPLTEKALRHINEIPNDLGASLVKSMIGTYTTGDLIVLEGCVVVANIPGTSTVTAGSIYYNGEIYQVDADASISSPSNTLVWEAVNTLVDGAQTTFSDAVAYDFLSIRKLRLVNGASGSGLANYNGATVKSKAYTFSAGGGGVYLALDDRTVHYSIGVSVGNKTWGQTIDTIPAEFRTTAQRLVYVSLSTFQLGGGNGQQGNSIPALLDTNTGVLTAFMDMAASHDFVWGSFSYLLD